MHDGQLLARYVDAKSEDAFGQIVSRYLKLVYHTSLREVGDADLAEDVTQAVFLVLAQKAPTLRRRDVLAGWLFETSRLTSLSALKVERRRRAATERLAKESVMDQTNKPEPAHPEISDALAALPAAETEAVVMRFVEERSFQEIGTVLGLSEEAARKRVSRAVDRMRRRLGVSGRVAATAVAGLLAAQAARGEVPNSLLKASAAFGGHSGDASGSLRARSLAQSVLHGLRVLQWKTAAVAMVALLATAVAVKWVAAQGAPNAHPAQAGPVPAGSVLLRYKFHAGDQHTYKLTADTTTTSGGAESHVDATMQQTVASVDPATGNATIQEQVSGRISETVRGTAIPVPAASAAALNRRATIVISPTGQLVSVNDHAAPAAGSGTEFMNGMQSSPVFPDGPVKPGDTWQQTQTIPSAGASSQVPLTLASVETRSGHTIAVIQMSYKTEVKPSPVAAKGVQGTARGSTTGSATELFDTDRGTLDSIDSTTHTDTTVTMAVPGTTTPVTVHVPMDMHMVMALADE